MKAEANADLDARWHRYERVRHRQEREATKYTRYCLEQCDLSRALAELEAKERAMYELENSKDQVMTCLKLALANFGMWVRDQYFPVAYAHATWHRMAPFFRHPGRVTEGKQTIRVELRPFNDRQLSRDLRVVCERVTAAQPRLPGGRRLCLTIAGTGSLSSDGQRCKVACIPDTLLPGLTCSSWNISSTALLGSTRQLMRPFVPWGTGKRAGKCPRNAWGQKTTAGSRRLYPGTSAE